MEKAGDKILVLCTSLLLLLVIGIMGIEAYSFYKKQISNVFTVGYNSVKIEEWFEPPEKLEPGTVIKKHVSVKNTGSVDCYVRVLVKYTSSTMEEHTRIDLNQTEWTKDGEYYYYNTTIAPNQTTEALFTQIAVEQQINEALLEPFDILVYAESRQAEGYQKSSWTLSKDNISER